MEIKPINAGDYIVDRAKRRTGGLIIAVIGGAIFIAALVAFITLVLIRL
jgi:hypothetical protein